MNIQKLRDQRRQKADAARKLVTDNPGDLWTEEHQKSFDTLEGEIKAIDAEITRINSVLALACDAEPLPADIEVLGLNGANGRVYRNLGEQLVDVALSADPSSRERGAAMERLSRVMGAASGAGSGVGSDGGYLVQTDFTTELMGLAHDASVLYGKCKRIPIGANADGLEAPIVDETSRATGSRWGGVQVYRRAEAETVTATKPKFGKLDLRLEDMMGLCYVTGRLLQDATALTAVIQQAFAEEFGFKLDDEIVRGTGAGECLGILNSDALVQVAKENGQGADTVLAENVMNMFARMPARFIGSAEWFINQELLPQLFKMHVAVGTGGIPVFMPPGGLSSAPYGMLFGRPVTPIEQTSALGDLGDIVFANLNQYLLIEKGGMQADESIHVRFLYDEKVFRFITRNNGMPLWKAPLTPYKGANTLSPFVALAERA